MQRSTRLFTGLALAFTFASITHAQFCGVYENSHFGPVISGDASFGDNMEIDGTTLVVSSWSTSNASANEGSVYIYNFDGSDWVLGQTLVSPKPAEGQRFGFRIALSGDVLAVRGHTNGGDVFDFDVYVYRLSDGSWNLEQKITPGNPDEMLNFGDSIEFQNNQLLIAASHDRTTQINGGAVYVYEFDGTEWVQADTITSATQTEGLYFGSSMVVDGDITLIGTQDDELGLSQGVYVFERGTNGWTEIDLVLPPTPITDSLFGAQLALNDGIMVVAAPLDSSVSPYDSLYVYREDAGSWIFEEQLVASRERTQSLGSSLSLKDGRLVAGAMLSSFGSVPLRGAALVFEYDGTSWSEQGLLLNQSGDFGSLLGASVAQFNDTVLIGAPGANQSRGDVYGFDLNAPIPTCRADMNSDCAFDFFDVSLFIQAYTSMSPSADFNDDQLFTFHDVSIFIELVNSGCPS